MEITYSNTITAENASSIRESAGLQRIHPEQLRAGLDKSALITAAYDQGRAIGMARLIWDGGFAATICDIIVSKEYNNCGIETELTKQIIDFLKSRLKPGFGIQVDARTRNGQEKLLEKLGFQVCTPQRRGTPMQLCLGVPAALTDAGFRQGECRAEKAGAVKPSAYTAQLPSPAGLLTLASDGLSLTGLWLENQKYFGSTLPEICQPAPSLPIFRETARWLDAYFAGKRPAMTLPLAPQGSEFRQAVWRAMLAVPYGETTTYGRIAASLPDGGRNYSQAVGSAVGHNPIMILIPCHRVLGSDGSLTGYAGGLECKKYLLRLKGIIIQLAP